MEPELVATAVHLDQLAGLHLMKATVGEQLPEGLERSSAGILINMKAIRVPLHKKTIAKEMETLQIKVIIAYFVGGGILQGSL